MNKSNKGIVLLAASILLILIGYPVLIIFIRSFSVEGELRMENYLQVFTDPKNYEALTHSLFISLTATVFSTMIGCGAAYCVARTDVSFKKWIDRLFLFNFFIPPFISAMAWQQILSPVGVVNTWLQKITGSSNVFINIYGQGGIIFVFTLSGSTMIYMILKTNFEKIQASLEEAAVITGASPLRILFDIVIPILKPSIFSAMILVFVSNISNYGVPSVLGFHVSYHTLTTRIHEVLQDFSIKNNMEMAAALSVVLVFITIMALSLKEKILKGKEFTIITGKSEKAGITQLGKFGKLLGCFWMLYGVFITICPLMSITATALTKAYGLPFRFENIVFTNFVTVLNMPLFRRSVKNSLFLAVTAAVLAVCLGFLVAYLCVIAKTKCRKVLEFIITMPGAIPGTVMAISMILAWMKPIPFLDFSLYNTLGIILIAYVANYATQAFRTISGSMYQINRSLEEAAVISGANLLKVITSIIIPLMKESVGTAWFLIFIPCLRELTLSIFLWSSGNETLATTIFTLQEAGNYTAACALSVIIIAVISLVNTVVNKFFNLNKNLG